MNPAIVAALVMLVGGAVLAVQAPANASLVRPLGSPLNAALASFVIGTIGLAIAAAVLRSSPDMPALRATPWYAWIGGLCGAVFVGSLAFATPRIGVAAALTLAILGQTVVALALDHVGAFGFPARPVDLTKILGVGLICAGVLLVRR